MVRKRVAFWLSVSLGLTGTVKNCLWISKSMHFPNITTNFVLLVGFVTAVSVYAYEKYKEHGEIRKRELEQINKRFSGLGDKLDSVCTDLTNHKNDHDKERQASKE